MAAIIKTVNARASKQMKMIIEIGKSLSIKSGFDECKNYK